MSDTDFRRFLPTTGRDPATTARAYTEARMQGERPQALFGNWRRLWAEQLRGLTTDGAARRDLFALQDDGAPTAATIGAVDAFMAKLSPAQKSAVHFPVGSDQWRNWQNTELFVETHGLRLDEQPLEIRDAAMDVVRASLSARGYEMSRDVMRLNGFLVELIGLPLVLGEWSYIFCLFGEPSRDAPWGWQLFDHHLCLNCFMLGGQMVLTPAFMGAEPAHGDEGRYKGIRLFENEKRSGLTLMRSFSDAEQAEALVAKSIMGSDLPDGPRAAKMTEIERHLGETHFCWIGDTAENSVFYYRIQSPVTFIEFDHHTGVFLTNDVPAKFHVHTIVRTPNGNDYGMDLLRLHNQQADHHH